MGHFDNPAARLEAFVPFGLDLLAARTHMRYVAMLADDGVGLVADIARVSTQIFLSGSGFGLANDLTVQNRFELTDIVAVGSDQNKSQRHAFFIDQKVPPCAVFFPCLWGFLQQHLRPSGP